MAPRPTKKSPGSTTPQPPPRPDLPVQARHPPPPGLPATAPRPTAVVGRVAELMGGKHRTPPGLPPSRNLRENQISFGLYTPDGGPEDASPRPGSPPGRQHCGDDHRGLAREDADHVRPALHLLVQPFE